MHSKINKKEGWFLLPTSARTVESRAHFLDFCSIVQEGKDGLNQPDGSTTDSGGNNGGKRNRRLLSGSIPNFAELREKGLPTFFPPAIDGLLNSPDKWDQILVCRHILNKTIRTNLQILFLETLVNSGKKRT